jgi:8-amino-7-oxononanoate synthase
MASASPLARRVHARIAALASNGLLRSLRPPAGVDLSSNDYLGLASHPHVVARFVEGVRREGAGSTGSRLLRGERECLTAIERRFARFKGTESALYFSSGYLANLAVLTTLAEAGDLILSDERNHASLIDGARLSRARRVVFPHNDVAAVRRELAGIQPGSVTLVVVESLFSMDGDMAPLADYAALCRDTGAVLVVDEAHAVGGYGPSGRGLVAESVTLPDAGPDPELVCISINTAGKALGVAGSFVAGPAWAIDYLVQRARSFVFSTAPPPAVADALAASLEIVESEPDRGCHLRHLSVYLRQGLAAAGIDVLPGTSHIVPVMIGDNERAVSVARALQQEGFDVRAIRPPTVPPGTARLRLSVNTGLTEQLLDRFIAALAAVVKETAFCSAVSS